MGRENVEVSHLQFADDTLFSLEAVVEGMKNLLKLLKVFCLVSGLRINMKKSLLLGINVKDNWLFNLASNLGYKVGSWPTKY